MSSRSQFPNRRSIRYKGFDYSSAGAYFVTVCTKDRLPVLEDEILRAIVSDVWFALPAWFPTVGLDEFVIMPNHVHFILWLGVGADYLHGGRPQGDGRPQGSPLRNAFGGNARGVGRDYAARVGGYRLPACEKPIMAPTLGRVVGTWKSLTTNVYLRWVMDNAPSRRAKFWQRNYYDRIVRNDRGLQAFRDYIRANPARWPYDPDNPENLSGLRQPESIHDYLADVRRFYQDKPRE